MFTRMAPPTKAEKERLDKYVLDERTARLPAHKRPDEVGYRGSSNDWDGRSYGGRPRNPKKRRRAPVSRHDATYTWKGGR